MNRNEERRRTFALFPIDTKGSSRDKRRSREREGERSLIRRGRIRREGVFSVF